eukprot:c5703_g1_i2.p1 GENE.c5703_g1_i2~~c5703_g1_i2.p1  ORF type:complete len:472 (+),score=119.94 c5703_g1_i2:130-1416(+)
MAIADVVVGKARLTTTKVVKVLMVDGVNPDNYVLAVWFAKLQLSYGEIAHIVMMGRPVGFELAQFVPKKDSERKKKIITDYTEDKIAQLWPKQPLPAAESTYEASYHNPAHARALLACTGFHMNSVLKNSGVDVSKVVLYDGGICLRAALSHRVHQYEDQFFDDDGFVRTPQEYKRIQNELFGMEPFQRTILRLESCVKKFYRLHDLADLRTPLMEADSVNFFVGGPMTALAKICDLAENICKKPGMIRAMSCSWNPGGLAGDNFNIQVDWPAFARVCIKNSFPNCQKIFITSDMCVASESDWIILKPSQLRDLGMYQCADLVLLWRRDDKFDSLYDLSVILPGFVVPGHLVRVKLSSSVCKKQAECLDATEAVTVGATATGYKCKLTELPPKKHEGDKVSTYFAFKKPPTEAAKTETPKLQSQPQQQ